MKKLFPVLFSLLLFFLTGFEIVYEPYKPIFMLRSEMEQNVKLNPSIEINNPGKIYLKDQFILINEKYRGVHVIDNSIPDAPKNVAFITIDGCIDMSVKGNVLYADNAVDLIAIRLDDSLKEIEITKRIKNVFPELLSPEGRGLNWEEQIAVPKDAILVRWELK